MVIQPNIELPKIELRKDFFSGQPNRQTKDLTWSLTKDYFLEIMRAADLHPSIAATHVVAAENGSVLVSVTVDIKTKGGVQVSSGTGSSMSVPGEERYASQGQKACTYAIKQALEWLFGITNATVLAMMKEIGVDAGKASAMSSGFGVAEAEPAPVELDDSDGIEI